MTSKLNLPENLQGKKKKKQKLIANMNKCKIKIIFFGKLRVESKESAICLFAVNIKKKTKNKKAWVVLHSRKYN